MQNIGRWSKSSGRGLDLSSSKDTTLWVLVSLSLMCAFLQSWQRKSIHSIHRAAAGSLSSQLLHMMGFLSCARTAATSIIVVTTKFGGKAPTPRSVSGTSVLHAGQLSALDLGTTRFSKHLLQNVCRQGNSRGFTNISWHKGQKRLTELPVEKTGLSIIGFMSISSRTEAILCSNSASFRVVVIRHMFDGSSLKLWVSAGSCLPSSKSYNSQNINWVSFLRLKEGKRLTKLKQICFITESRGSSYRRNLQGFQAAVELKMKKIKFNFFRLFAE